MPCCYFATGVGQEEHACLKKKKKPSWLDVVAQSLSSSMASSSNSEFKCSYDIFLSFRGSDTRNQFTDHLYEALKREGFETFRDNEGIERGENINSELQKAIRNSSMSVIVLSKTYATSKSCLFEIQTILEHHKKKSDHVIFPVFYEVEPSEIKEQAKNLDFRGKKVTDEEVKGWSAGLKEVAKMGGFVYFNNRSEAKFIEEIIGALKSKQADKHSRDLNDNMQNLKRKLEDLSGQEDDVKTKISNAERWQGKRPKKEVEVWRRNVQRVKDNVRRLEQKVDGETNVSSCMRLEKDIATQILEVQEFHKKGRDFNSPMIDELPTGRLSIPPVKDFVRCTKARNTENIWECVMKDDVTKIGVYGMGGVGKTTIMKDIYNQLLGKFGNVYWVTVSKAFDITNLQSRILKSLNLTLKEDEEEISKASRLYATLSRQKRYVLILDDIWEPFSLEVVGIPEPIRHNGCKLVLTTRSLEVCQTMDCTPVKVHLFTEKEALTLFLTKAVGHDTVLAPEVEEIAAKIAKECACLPLAIVTIAGSLRGLKGIREWRNALNELISSTKDASGDVNKVFERLKFSYSRLGNKVLQDCFLYCSLYPEDYKIPVNELIEYWIVEELITDMDSVEAQFDKGHAILGKLTSSCLLESFSNVSKREYVRMHDLIRDMALRIATNRPRFRVKAGERLQSIPYEVWYEDLDKASFMHCYISELPIRPPICPRLTTLLLREVTTNFPLTFPNDFFINMPCLTVLDLSFCNIEKLPESISNLENLHALLLEVCGRLADVPSVKKLKALKVFKLTYSEIEELPEGIEELINLRKLDLSHNMGLGPFPSRLLRKLSKLQYLRTDGTKIQLSVEDLLCLKQLKVVSVRFHNVQELNSYVRSRQLQGMEKYCLIVGKGYFDIWDLGKEVHIGLLESVPSGSVVDDLVFPADINYFELRRVHDLVSLSAIPCWNGARDLRECTVRRCYGLECIFSEDGQISLGTVESLTLDKLPSFRVLFDRIAPPHNIYSNLKKLDFWDCHTVKNIFPVQFLQNFPNLESLSAYRCENLEDIISETVEMSDWGNHEDDSNTISLPKLKVLCLFDLPSLKSIYNGMMVCHSIEEVDVRKCPLVRRLPLSLHMDSEQATAPPALKSIRANDEWWESLVWDDPRAKQILQPLRQPGRKYLDDYDHYQNDDSEDSDNFFDEDSKDYDNYSNEDSEDYDNYSDEDSISTLVDSFSRMYIS